MDGNTTPPRQACVYVLVGLPGSGKSTWLKERGANAISSDALRLLLIDDETHQGIHRRVFRTVRYLLRQRLELGRPETYVDATNLTPKDRRPYIVISQLYNARVEAVYLDVPLEVCKQRNAARARVVPEDALEVLAAKLVAPTRDEGFDAVQRIPFEPRPSAAQDSRAEWV